MPLQIVRHDIIHMDVDAIVDPANPRPLIGAGCDAGIHQAAGPALLAARQKIGHLAAGQAAMTPGFGLTAKYVLHVVSPPWQGGDKGEKELLRQCYDRALRLAMDNNCASVAFPLLAAGNYGFPPAVALEIAINAFSAFLLEHELQIYLVVFQKDVFALSEKLFASVQSYIDENYVADKTADEYGSYPLPRFLHASRRKADFDDTPLAAPLSADFDHATLSLADEAPLPPTASVSAAPQPALSELLKKADVGFSEYLLQLIDRSGLTDAAVYKRANVDRKLFSKIRNNPAYQPKKATALAFALALELDLEETKALLGRAGYALTHSSRSDIIVEYFIRQQNYNVIELNEVLFAFDQPLIGA